MSLVSNIIVCAFAQSHILLILQEGSLFGSIRNRLFKIKFLKELITCKMCLGFWVAMFVNFILLNGNLISLFSIAGIGHIISLLREKYLPCKQCEVAVSNDGVNFVVI